MRLWGTLFYMWGNYEAVCLFHIAANDADILFFYILILNYLEFSKILFPVCLKMSNFFAFSLKEPAGTIWSLSKGINSVYSCLASISAGWGFPHSLWCEPLLTEETGLPLQDHCHLAVRPCHLRVCHSLSSVTLTTLWFSIWVANLFGLLQFCRRFFWSIFLCFLLWPLKP